MERALIRPGVIFSDDHIHKKRRKARALQNLPEIPTRLQNSRSVMECARSAPLSKPTCAPRARAVTNEFTPRHGRRIRAHKMDSGPYEYWVWEASPMTRKDCEKFHK